MAQITEYSSFHHQLALSLVPSLLELAKQSTLSHASAQTDPEARQAKLQLSKQASAVKQSLATLKAQAEQLPAANLSLDDQDWIINQLEEQLQSRRLELSELAKRLPASDSPEPMSS